MNKEKYTKSGDFVEALRKKRILDHSTPHRYFGAKYMLCTIQQWGNSLAFRIPKIVALEMGIFKGSKINMKMGKDGLFLQKPQKKSHYELDQLLKNTQTEDFYPEVCTGGNLGNEAW